MNCQYEDCKNEGFDLFYPDERAAGFCDEHLHSAGFCAGCHGFYGGIESFHFHEPAGYCDDCKSNGDLFPQWREYECDSCEGDGCPDCEGVGFIPVYE